MPSLDPIEDPGIRELRSRLDSLQEIVEGIVDANEPSPETIMNTINGH